MAKDRIEAYCEAYGHDLVVDLDPIINVHGDGSYRWGNFEKLACVRYLDRYERILRLDTDIIIRPDTPDIFPLVAEGTVGGVQENVGGRWVNRGLQMQRAMAFNPINWDGVYINSGVVVIDRSMRELFTVPDKRMLRKLGQFKEQTWLNYLIAKYNVPKTVLGREWNGLSMFKAQDIAWFIHLAGRQDTKLESMRQWKKATNENKELVP